MKGCKEAPVLLQNPRIACCQRGLDVLHLDAPDKYPRNFFRGWSDRQREKGVHSRPRNGIKDARTFFEPGAIRATRGIEPG